MDLPNPISPIGLRNSITVYTSQPKSRKSQTIKNGFKISFSNLNSRHATVPQIGRPILQKSLQNPNPRAKCYSNANIGRPVFQIGRPICLKTANQQTKPFVKPRVKTHIKSILTKPGLPQQPLGLSSRARTCGTRFRRTDPEESSKDLKSQKYGF